MYVRVHKQECSENIFLDNHKESGKENIVLKDRIFCSSGTLEVPLPGKYI
jgi:hypothetical protein